MDAKLKLAEHILKFIINKSLTMKSDRKNQGEESSHTISKVVGSLAAGAAVGLAAGILLAPDKGKKTREKLLGEAKDLTNKLKNKADEFIAVKTSK